MIKKIFGRILNFLNIHPDNNQRWVLGNVFVVGLLYTYIQPAMTKAIITVLPAEWIAFQSLSMSACGLFIGIIWQGYVRNKAIKWFTALCVAESLMGFLLGMYLCFVHYNVWVFAIATLIYGTLITEFVNKCLMTFRPKLWNEREREIYDNNNDIICGIFCIIGFTLSLLFMPSLKVALFIWGFTCGIDNIGWIVLYHKNKAKLRANEKSLT